MTDKAATPTPNDSKLGTEVFLALAAVGWADGNLDTEEADAIVRTALEEGLDVTAIEAIEEAVKEPLELGRLDLSKMPKADRLFVYAVASWITRVDGEVDESETAMLDQLGEALRIPEKPRALAAEMAKEISELEDGAEPAFFNLPKLRRTIKARLADAQSMRAKQKEAAERGD